MVGEYPATMPGGGETGAAGTATSMGEDRMAANRSAHDDVIPEGSPPESPLGRKSGKGKDLSVDRLRAGLGQRPSILG